MSDAIPMIELWRGGLLESVHCGHAVIWGRRGLEAAWGDPFAVIYPRSAMKMIQALPLVESGGGRELSLRRLALACSSHQGSALHVAEVAAWLADLGFSEKDLLCGTHEPFDRDERERLIRHGERPSQLHNNCSGKHTGFLMLGQHLGGGPHYVDPNHPVQCAVRAAFEELTGAPAPGFGIDGCSAPNFATTLAGLARAMQAFAVAGDGDARGRAMRTIVAAMRAYPELVAGEGRACTELMRACQGLAIKTGAEGVFTAIWPARGLGLALKIADGSARAAEAALVALLIHFGALEPRHPAAVKRLGPVVNWRGLVVGELRRASQFPA